MKKRTLWTNKFDYIDEYAEMLKADYPDYFEDMNDEDKINERAYELACDFNNDTLDEIRRFAPNTKNDIIIIGNLGLWDGRRTAIKELNTTDTAECFYSDCDTLEWYIDEHNNLCATASHHDGTNSYIYREWKDNISDTQKNNFFDKIYNGNLERKDITKYTKAIGKYFMEV